jgi:hypothetical protein
MKTVQSNQPARLGATSPGAAGGGSRALPCGFLLPLAVVCLLLTGAAARADFISTTLGSAGPGNYAILSIGTGKSDVALNGPGTTTGNVGVLSGTLSLASSAPPAVVGNVFLGSGAGPNFSAAKQVQGTVFTGQTAQLTQARTEALNAAATFAGLAPTLSVAGNVINGTTTITGTAGVNVLNISGLHLGNGRTLTLNAPSGSQFVINDSGGFTLNSGRINLAGGLSNSDVVFNVTGTGPALSTSGGLHHESVVNGILLAPGRGIAFAPGLVNGEAIAGGKTIHFVSGAEVNGPPPSPPPPGPPPLTTPPPPAAPEPASVLLLALGLPALAVCGYRARRPRSAPAA